MLRSHHRRNAPRQKPAKGLKRGQAVYGTKSYWDGLQRAFNKAKAQIYFNPDMTNFITLTYAENMQDIDQCLKDVKLFIREQRRANERLHPAGSGRATPLKYIFIMEYQKRGALHVHMISNNFFTLHENKNGYNSLTLWKHGYSSILSINDFDNNFRPYLYLFKYMKKSQRIGKSFVHSSRNLTNYTQLETGSIDLQHWDTKNMELTTATVETTKFTYYKNYLQFNGTIETTTTNPRKGDINQWLEQVKLHSNKELAKILANHSQR